jgi:hypothetical protein
MLAQWRGGKQERFEQKFAQGKAATYHDQSPTAASTMLYDPFTRR